MRPDQERVRNLLIDTVTLLCKNSVQFENELHVEGLLGVSVDKKDVFFVHISKEFSNSPSGGATVTETNEDGQDEPTENSTDCTNEVQRSKERVGEPAPANERVSIKTEAVEQPEQEECLIVEDPHIKLEGRASPAQLVAGQRRAAKRTSHSGNHQYGDGGLQAAYGLSDHYDNAQYGLGEPLLKRHAADDGRDGDDYLQGDDSGDTGEGTPWPSLAGPAGFDPSQAFQHDSDNSQISIDGSQQPGCSSWSTPGRGPSDSVCVHVPVPRTAIKRACFSGTDYGSQKHSPSQPRGKHECTMCNMAFQRANHLEKHIRTHTGEKPFKCSSCGRCFARRDVLERHVKSTHRERANTEEGPTQPPPGKGVANCS